MPKRTFKERIILSITLYMVMVTLTVPCYAQKSDKDTMTVSLQEYAGRYGDGLRTITLEDGSLYIQRRSDGGPAITPKLKLVPSGKDEFYLELFPAARINFVRDSTGAIMEMKTINVKGQKETNKRDPS